MTSKTDIVISGTCRVCGHGLVIDQEMSNAADVPADEIYVECEQETYPNRCTSEFIKIDDVR